MGVFLAAFVANVVRKLNLAELQTLINVWFCCKLFSLSARQIAEIEMKCLGIFKTYFQSLILHVEALDKG